MDYIWKAIGIVFIVTVVIFIYNALQIQQRHDHFQSPKAASQPTEADDKQI